jgi:hypothetical protein
VVDITFGVAHQERAHERFCLLRSARDDASKQIVGHAQRLGLRDEVAHLGIGDGLARQRRHIGHLLGSEGFNEPGAGP